MNLADITTKCYILALIIRDDGERLLLGDGAYEFKDSQQHFIANTYANDVVELQGTDGQMLAGQVRRTATQTFAGYIGDASFSKQKIEAARRDFLMFFRKKHYYTAVYVFSDGTAIQRDRGYIVNAPSVPELYQRYPEWSVGLNFEDPNYYEYAEDDLGHEIAAHKVELELSTAMSGGLIWDGDGAVSDDLSYVGTEIPGEGKNFQLADTGTATLKSAELLGDATQTTYSGKNLIPYPYDGTTVANGITFTDNGDGSITINGTNNGNGNSSFYLARNLKVSAGTYYTIAQNQSIGLVTYNGSQYDSIEYPSYSKTISTAETWTMFYIQIRRGDTTTFNNFRYYPMLTTQANPTMADYEPYVGGTASPNPDYPQAVNTVTGEQTVKIEGKNLFDKDNANILNAYIDASHTSITSNSNNRIIWIPCQPSTSYTLQKLAVGTNWYTRQIAYTTQEPAVGVQTYSMTDMAGNDTSKTYTTGADAKYLVVRIWVSGQDDETLEAMLGSVQLELGSTATAYEPYQAQEFEVNLGKNLCDYGTQSFTTFYQQSGLSIPAETYTFSATIVSSDTSQTVSRVYFYHGNSSLGYIQLSRNTRASATITLSDSADRITLYASLDYSSSNGKTATYTDIQLEKGSTATSYAPYFPPIELAKIGNYQDRIYKNDGKWYIHKAVRKIIYNGTENWSTQNDIFVRGMDDIAQGEYKAEVLMIADHFTGLKTCYRSEVANGSCAKIVGANQQVGFRYDALNNVTDDWKTWLGTHNTTVYYALATPTTTEITNSELLGQLERLRHAHTYADTTNFSITATSPNLPAYLKVVAFGDDATPQGGYVWEDGGTGGATTITVDGVDNAQPIWTVVGPATNPSLTNITTGESIQWTGVVPNGQTLVVNMADMTASLSGANVFEFISGSWITLQAGNNRVSYSATAATGIATLEWNGVVG